MRRGEVRWYTFKQPDKRRPVLILTRNSAIPYLTNVTVAPITSTIRDIPTEVFLDPREDGVRTPCVVNLDNVQTVPKHKIGRLLSKLSFERMEEVDRALCFALGVDRFF
ncbi:MAG: type II toxin-antitoxin system PemK/MazF family toxin [Chloroflexi bacterium]|nr:type II toxin-antitoxin system PemK/MazF family toxin [Chloroflexota bacterium]